MAGLFRGLLGRLGIRNDITSGVSNPAQWLTGLVGGHRSVSGTFVSPHSSLRSAAVWACVHILSEDLAKIDAVLYSGRPRDGTRVENTDHPLAMMFSGTSQVNSWMTLFEYWRFHMMSYLLHGNAYTYVPRNARGQVTALVPIPPSRVTIYEAPDGDLFYSVSRGSNHELAVLANAPLVIPSAFIMHDRGPTLDGVHGMSVIGSHTEAIGLSLAGEDYASRTLNSGARPSGLLKHPKMLTDESAKRLRAQFNELYAGLDNSGRTILLEDGVDFTPVTMPNNDMQFIEGRRLQIEEIARMFLMPPHKIGIMGGATNSNIDAENRQYVTDTLMRHIERIESLIQSKLLTDQERGKYFLEFDVDRIMRGDPAARYNGYAVGRQWGWWSVNDIRRMENLGPVDGGETYLQPYNMVPLGTKVPLEERETVTEAVPGAPSITAPGTQPPGSGARPAKPART